MSGGGNDGSVFADSRTNWLVAELPDGGTLGYVVACVSVGGRGTALRLTAGAADIGGGSEGSSFADSLTSSSVSGVGPCSAG